MTPLQAERWFDFSRRMARTCFKGQTEPDEQWIIDEVESFLGRLDPGDFVSFKSWDHNEPYPEGHDLRRALRTYTCGCQYPDSYSGGKRAARPDCPCCHGTGRATEWQEAPYLSDLMSEWETEACYYQLYRLRDDLDSYWADIHEEIFGDSDLIDDPLIERWSAPVHCCIRAGIDMASEPSMGVMGFTAGDIRRMYPEGVPDWLFGDEPLDSVPINGVIPGIGFVPGEPVKNGTFADLPDNASMWL